MRFVKQGLKLVKCAVIGRNVLIIGDIIAVVGIR